MKKNLAILMLIVTISAIAKPPIKTKKADEATEKWRYEIECVGVGTNGTYLIKVWSFSKNANVAIEQAKKNAIHGIIFKGVVGGGQSRCATQKPMAASLNVEAEKATFFDRFFGDGGEYMKYVNVTSSGNIAATDRLKVGKEYKIGVVVSVMKEELRAYLESQGIIRGLNSGF
jgi:hypothetical protein